MINGGIAWPIALTHLTTVICDLLPEVQYLTFSFFFLPQLEEIGGQEASQTHQCYIFV